MQKIRWSRIIAIVGLVSLTCAYLFLWLGMFTSHEQRTGTDFVTFYTVGRLGNELGLDKVYKFSEQHRIQEELVGFPVAATSVMPHNHVPLINPLLVLLIQVTQADFLAGMLIWDAVMLGLSALAVFVLQKLQPDATPNRPLRFVSALYFYPIFVSILLGQDTALVLLGAALWVWGLKQKNDHLSGLGLALTTLRPHLALVLAIPFLFNRRKIWWWFFVYAAVMVVLSILPLGVNGVLDFFHILTDTVVRSKEYEMVNFIGLLVRVVPLDSTVLRSLGWGLYLTSIAGVSLLWKQSKEIQIEHAGIAIVLALFFAPHLVYHDLSLLLIPLLAILWEQTQQGRLRLGDIPSLLFGLSMLLMLSFASRFTQFLLPYLLMLGLLYFLFKNIRAKNALTQR